MSIGVVIVGLYTPTFSVFLFFSTCHKCPYSFAVSTEFDENLTFYSCNYHMWCIHATHTHTYSHRKSIKQLEKSKPLIKWKWSEISWIINVKFICWWKKYDVYQMPIANWIKVSVRLIHSVFLCHRCPVLQ